MFNNTLPDVELPCVGGQYVEGECTSYVKESNFVEVDNWKNPCIIDLSTVDTYEELFTRFHDIWIHKLRHSESTFRSYVNDLYRMIYDTQIPVDLLHPNPGQIIAFLEFHEHPEHPYRTIDPWKAVTALYRCCGIDTKYWGYRPPPVPPAKVRVIPSVMQVRDICTHKYVSNRLHNRLIQYTLFYGFMLGLRPQEYPLIRVEDVYPDQGYLIITEPKKGRQRRQIFLEQQLWTRQQTKSLGNLLQIHDDINSDNPYLFMQFNGRRWTTDHFRQYHCNLVKPLFPAFTMYCMRHWAAIAQLIRTKVESGKYDVYQVKEYLGHDQLHSTEQYIRYAQMYYRSQPFDWISVLLKAPKWVRAQTHEKRTNAKNDVCYAKSLLLRGTALSGLVPGFSCWFCETNSDFGMLSTFHPFLFFSSFDSPYHPILNIPILSILDMVKVGSSGCGRLSTYSSVVWGVFCT